MSTIARAYEGMQTFKAFIAALTFIAVGAVFLWDPSGEVEAVVPHRLLVGAALAGFGFLFLVTMLAKGEVRYRLTSLLLLLLSLGVLGGLYMLLWPQVQVARSLATDGRLCTATAVRASSVLPSRSRRFLTLVRFEAGTAIVPLQTRIQAGARVGIRYLPGRPEVAVPTVAGSDWWSILHWGHTKTGTYVILGIAAFALLSIPFTLSNFLHGSRETTSPEP